MATVAGIDPGASGALCVYNSDTGIVAMHDMPTWMQQIGKKKRKRVDPVALDDLFKLFAMLGVELVVIEDVMGRGNEIGGAAFSYGIGVLDTVAMYSGIPVEKVTPQVWKKMLNVKGKSRADDSAIIQKANALFPDNRDMFKGVRGGNKVDRAEAAMMALYGVRHILHNVGSGATYSEVQRAYSDRKLGITGGV